MQTQRVIPYDRWKRLLDVFISAPLLLVTLPLQALVAVMVAVKLGRPILFRQSRPGLNGEVFTLLKFRSMDEADPEGEHAEDEQRLGRFGESLRSTSFDELPSLWNVLRGDMSIVGPRPLLVEYLPLYDSFQARRHEVRPGITGLAQISGRNAISWQRKFECDVDYVDRRSLALDAKVMVITIRNVITRRDIASESHVTMPRFIGYDGGSD